MRLDPFDSEINFLTQGDCSWEDYCCYDSFTLPFLTSSKFILLKTNSSKNKKTVKT